MIYEIVTHNSIIGSHCWKNAPDKFAYLRDLHRHVFEIRCRFKVSHTDREIEINDMQDTIEAHFKEAFESGAAGINFGTMSCEDIARYCIEQFNCNECEVLEDGFGGANVKVGACICSERI